MNPISLIDLLQRKKKVGDTRIVKEKYWKFNWINAVELCGIIYFAGLKYIKKKKKKDQKDQKKRENKNKRQDTYWKWLPNTALKLPIA